MEGGGVVERGGVKGKGRDIGRLRVWVWVGIGWEGVGKGRRRGRRRRGIKSLIKGPGNAGYSASVQYYQIKRYIIECGQWAELGQQSHNNSIGGLRNSIYSEGHKHH